MTEAESTKRLVIAGVAAATGLYLIVSATFRLVEGDALPMDLAYWCLGAVSLFISSVTFGSWLNRFGFASGVSAAVPVAVLVGLVVTGLTINETVNPRAPAAETPSILDATASGVNGLSIVVDQETGCEWLVTEQGGSGGHGPSSIVPRTERLADGTDRQICREAGV